MTENLPPNERTRREQNTNKNGLIFGLVLLALGAYFMLENLDVLNFIDTIHFGFEWWALFILIPGGILLYRGLQASQAGQSQNRHVRNQIVGGGLLILVGLVSVFDFTDWDLFWPVALIIGGAFMLMNRSNNGQPSE